MYTYTNICVSNFDVLFSYLFLCTDPFLG
jgi:hypothetical protein